jgi:glycosyltransferase involved in cell wall biosynthesis
MRIIRIADTAKDSFLRSSYSRLRNFRPYRFHGPDVVWKFINSNSTNFLDDGALEDFTWYVSGDILNEKESISSQSKQGSSFIFGPNIQFEDETIRDFIKSLTDFRIIVPSNWVWGYFKAREFFPSEKVIVWPTGIDLNFWKVGKFTKKRHSVILYLKGPQDPHLIEVTRQTILDLGMSPIIVRYGDYNVYSYRRKLRRARALLHFGVSESQGISLLESWAMNVPTGVLSVHTYSDSQGIAYPASAAPYLDDETGIFLNLGSKFDSDLRVFLSQIGNFSPRKSVEDRFHASVLFQTFKSSLGL